MDELAKDEALRVLRGFVGEWAIEATHPAYPATVVHGRASVEWLEGGHFLIQRSQTENPDFPDALAVIGPMTDGLCMQYFDSRGVHRVYAVSASDGVWRMSRDAPDFSQRFTGRFSEDGDAIAGLWELSRDGSSWDDDLEINYRRLR